MEDGDNSEMDVSAPIKAAENIIDVENTMANYPDVEITKIKTKTVTDNKTSEQNTVKVNGESEKIQEHEQDEYTTDEDTLIIDEDCSKKVNHKRIRSPSPRANFKGFKKRIIAKSLHLVKIVNSIRKTYQIDDKEPKQNRKGELNDKITKDSDNTDTLIKNGLKSLNDASSPIESPKHKHVPAPSVKSQKLTEYAQYLGLQPTVKFKCVKCSESSFPSLSALNEHQRQCLAQPSTTKPSPSRTPTTGSTNFRVTRKVFLCSSCGTYYENCNLFLHMREVHRRYICLYCLGMFSLPEKLSHHLVTKHNCSPNRYSSAEDFLNSYSESCFLVCCHCEKVFSERDNFFDHSCGTQKLNNHKKYKPVKNNQQVQHVTGDSPSSSSLELEEDKTGGHFMADVLPALEMANNDSPILDNKSEDFNNPKVPEETISERSDLKNYIGNTEGEEKILECKEKSIESEEKNTENEEKNTENEEKTTEGEENIIEGEEKITEGKENHEQFSSIEFLNDIIQKTPEKNNCVTGNEEIQEETRKVPKVTLKLQGLIYSDNESSDSEKLTMEIEDNYVSEAEFQEKPINGLENSDDDTDDSFQVAGDDVPIVELELQQPLDKIKIDDLLKSCLGETITTCIYCNHARKIAVNGKQLGLHAIAEHRFSATVNSITAEELIPKNFVQRIKEGLEEIESLFFSLKDSAKLEIGDIPDDSTPKRMYECFQCRFVTTIHKELYLHNRKMHAKTILLCIMCKSNFYSYSELICHLCPGNYLLNSETKFRCCICDINNLPSAFRLMVHLRKRHHTCDVCLEECFNQSKLSNHVWKHKLHHLCYRCGIAYRNKPDITKHLFWKHGTESVLCKKCLQKKWPHVYHFCIPPATFLCEECNVSFSKAVYLKVHKRLHIEEEPHSCSEQNCTEKFISKKLLEKHEKSHREPEPIESNVLLLEEPNVKEEETKQVIPEDQKETNNQEDTKTRISPEKEEIKPKNLIDVYDLPALNLSESDSDDSEDEKSKTLPTSTDITEEFDVLNEIPVEEDQKPVPILDGIWDDFKNYQATIEKNSINVDLINNKETEKIEKEEIIADLNTILKDHDYCSPIHDTIEMEVEGETIIKNDETTGLDHDYCTINTLKDTPNQLHEATSQQTEKKKCKTPKKKSSSSSDSSSDSDSSSCTCGSNCSCSSSSGSSSSSSSSSESDSSSSEGKRRILARREKRKERPKRKKSSETSAVDVVATEEVVLPPPKIELPIQESDLDTDETETDEDFYDEFPQRIANKLLAEKRKHIAMLVSNGAVLENSRPSTPSIPEEVTTIRKKVKTKKRKKKSRSSTPKHQNIPLIKNNPTVPSPLIINQPLSSLPAPAPQQITVSLPVVLKQKKKLFTSTPGSGSETETNVRSSKRRRVPNKFYGYSSDEETEKSTAVPVLKWRKTDLPTPPSHVTGSPQIVPTLTIKNIPTPAPVIEPLRTPVIHHTEFPESDTDAEETPHRKISSESSDENHQNNDSDSEDGQLHISQPTSRLSMSSGPQRPTLTGSSNVNLYCYCQCPYDEVSEMIACDGRECAIEWFHFECVGIMVPPKGKWYCPECRKKITSRSDFIQI